MARNLMKIEKIERLIAHYKAVKAHYDKSGNAITTAKALSVHPTVVYNANSKIPELETRLQIAKDAEKSVVKCAKEGMTNPDICKLLGLSLNIVKGLIRRSNFRRDLSTVSKAREKAKSEARKKRIRNKDSRIKKCTEWVRCACKRSQKRSTDVHCAICDNEENRKLAGLPIAPIGLSFDYFYNQQ